MPATLDGRPIQSHITTMRNEIAHGPTLAQASYGAASTTIPRNFGSYGVIVNGSIVYTGGLARCRREAVKRSGMIIVSPTVIRVTL